MGYRGEDAPRKRADSRRQPPWQPSSGKGPAATSWDDGAQGYSQEDSYAGNGAHGGYDGYPPDDSYAGYGDYDQHAGYDQRAGHDGYGHDGHDGYGEPNGYGGDGDYGYPQGDGYGGSGAQPAMPGGYGRSPGYPPRAEGHSLPGGYPAQPDDYSGSGGYPAQGGGYGGSGGYPAQPDEYSGSGGYPAQRDYYGRSGGYPAQPDDYSGSGGYPAQGGGYGGSGGYPAQAGGYGRSGSQPALPGGHDASGGYPVQGNGPGAEDVPGRYAGNDWYGRPNGASGSGFADTGTYNLDARAIDAYGTGPRPPALEAGDPPGLVHTGQQERLDDDEYEPYPGYEGHDDYDDAPGYPNPQGYDQGGYDEPGSGGYDVPYEDRYGDPGTAPRPAAQPGKGGKAKKGSGGKDGKRTLLLAAIVVVIVGIAGAAGYVFVLKPKPAANSSSTGPLPSPGSTSAATAACVKQFGQYCHIELRTDDPKPLTIDELFPPAFVNETDHGSFTLAGTKLDTTCSNAVIGQDLISALQTGKCTQVLRASYVSGNNQIMGTIGVANLATTNGAHEAGRLVGTNDFVAPLSTPKGIASKLGQGTGIVQSEYKGHYLIMIWAEFANTKAPAGNAQDQELQQFGSDLIAGTANISLSQRMVNGAPATAAG
jgi:hypothetical protein